MKTIKFKELWNNYPNESACKKEFTNQCAIKLGAALAKTGVDTTTLVPANRHCWYHKNSEGHILAADELARGLKKIKLSGVSPAIAVTGANFKARLAGKKGIVYFEDYWLRATDNLGSPTGDHIDLWNGSRLTDWKSWVRIQFGLVIPEVWSDFEKAKTILFWKIEE
jgi:hypothetical protein